MKINLLQHSFSDPALHSLKNKNKSLPIQAPSLELSSFTRLKLFNFPHSLIIFVEELKLILFLELILQVLMETQPFPLVCIIITKKAKQKKCIFIRGIISFFIQFTLHSQKYILNIP